MGVYMLSKILKILILINKFIMGSLLIIFNLTMGFFCVEFCIFLSKEVNYITLAVVLTSYILCNIVMFKSFKFLRGECGG